MQPMEPDARPPPTDDKGADAEMPPEARRPRDPDADAMRRTVTRTRGAPVRSGEARCNDEAGEVWRRGGAGSRGRRGPQTAATQTAATAGRLRCGCDA